MIDILSAALVSRLETLTRTDHAHLPQPRRPGAVRLVSCGLLVVAVAIALATDGTDRRNEPAVAQSLHSFPPPELAILAGIAYISGSSNNQESPQ